jgi:hypothetical protein
MTTLTPQWPDRLVAALITDTSPYLSCDECFGRLDEYVDRRVRGEQHPDPAMDAHLRGCAACHEEAETLLELVAEDAAGTDDGPVG